MRRWAEGMRGDFGGVSYRVVPGDKPYKPPGDLKLEWFVNERWRGVPSKVGGVLADFIYENEEFLYPRERGWKGGGRYLAYINGAALSGWQSAEALLQKEREERDRKNRTWRIQDNKEAS